MDRDGWQELAEQLSGTAYQFGLITPGSPVHRVVFDASLTDAEVDAAEARYGFRFPPDLQAFLQTALPAARGSPTGDTGTRRPCGTGWTCRARASCSTWSKTGSGWTSGGRGRARLRRRCGWWTSGSRRPPG